MPRVREYAAAGPFPYPLTSALIAAPFAGLRPPAAGGLFIGISFTVLAFALTKLRYWPLLTLLSAPLVLTLTNVQWSPLLLAAVLLPGLGWLGAAKPNLGVIAFALYPQWSTVIGGGFLLAIAFFLIPAWPLEWLQHVRMATLTYRPVATWPLGAVGLLGLLRWRTFEGRVLTAMTLVPLAPFHYDPPLPVARPALMAPVACPHGMLVGVGPRRARDDATRPHSRPARGSGDDRGGPVSTRRDHRAANA